MADQTTRLFALFGGLLMMGGLVLALRWTWGTGGSMPAPPVPDPNDPNGYGLLEEVAAAPTAAAAEMLRARLLTAGIRATVGPLDGGGYRLLVFSVDRVEARIVLGRGSRE